MAFKNLCCFGPGGQADHLVKVVLADGVVTSYTDKVIIVEGVLRVSPYRGPDGFTWSVYDLAGDGVQLRRR